MHKKSKHEGIRYPCDQCDHAAITLANLKHHKESKHEGIRYPCDQCEYAATKPSDLKLHKQSLHEGIRYPCDQCEYASTQHSYLKFHKKSRHSKVPRIGSTYQNSSTILRRKVNVRIEKLNYSKYLQGRRRRML